MDLFNILKYYLSEPTGLPDLLGWANISSVRLVAAGRAVKRSRSPPSDQLLPVRSSTPRLSRGRPRDVISRFDDVTRMRMRST